MHLTRDSLNSASQRSFPAWGYGVIVAAVFILFLFIATTLLFFIKRRNSHPNEKASAQRKWLDTASATEVPQKVGRRLSESSAKSTESENSVTKLVEDNGTTKNQGQQGPGETRSSRDEDVASPKLDLGMTDQSIPLALLRMTRSEQRALKDLPLIRVNEKGELEPAKKPPAFTIGGRSDLEDVDLEAKAFSA